MRDDFAALILTHGRPNKVHTYTTLLKKGYTGKVYIVIDNEDKTADEYYAKFGDKVIMFDKKAVAAQIDEGDNFNDRRAIIYARNASFQIAKNLGLKYFIQLDDDYTAFRYRVNRHDEYGQWPIRNLDAVLTAMVEFYENTPNITTFAMSQGGDHIGGANNGHVKKGMYKRKAMNTIICSVDRSVQYFGRINEDVNVYATTQQRGDIHLTTFQIEVTQLTTQTNAGGMTDIYKAGGTYKKSFYSVMYAPSAVKIRNLMVGFQRLHHMVDWNAAAPLILREEHKKRKTTSQKPRRKTDNLTQ
jgi:hypothetical protein